MNEYQPTQCDDVHVRYSGSGYVCWHSCCIERANSTRIITGSSAGKPHVIIRRYATLNCEWAAIF